MENSLEAFLPLEEFKRRIKWLITLRWIASLGLFIVITVARYILDIELPLLALYLGNLALILLNIFYSVYYRNISFNSGSTEIFKRANRFINVQISLDLIILAYLIYLSGGTANPFILFFIFHMVIASILLANGAAYLQATFAILLFAIIMAAERFTEAPVLLSFSEAYFPLGTFLAFVSTIYIVVYMSTTIVNKLRKRERELEAINSQLEIANKELEEKDRAKSLYVQTVSHDIKGSLSSIQSCLKVVLKGLTGTSSPKTTEMVTRAEKRSVRLLHFVDDLLYLSFIRTEKEPRIMKLSVTDVAKRVVADFSSWMEEKGLLLHLETLLEDSAISADPYGMDQLFINLLDNAVKFTPPGGRIIIRLEEEKSGGCIKISVMDNGIGVPKEDLPHIFKDFFRARNAVHIEPEGSGLGLAIVKYVTETHKGAIQVISSEGKGSSFSLTLPKSIT